jgi:hypothetical protein
MQLLENYTANGLEAQALKLGLPEENFRLSGVIGTA